MNKPILIDNSDENADWIKTLPGHQDELAIHDSLVKPAAKELTLLQRVEHGLAALGEAIKSIFEAREKEAVPEPDFLYTDAKSVLTRGEKGQFITKDGQVIFMGGPGSGGGTAGGSGGGLPAGHAEVAAANRLGIAGEVGYAELAPEAFADIRDATVPADKVPFVTPYSADEYKEMGAHTFLSESGKSGYALKPDGDIISVFSSSGAREGKWVISSAIANGGTKLDCFDGFLAKDFYPTFGFKEYDRLTWNNEYAPKNWNYDKYDNPDVVLMRLE